MADVELPPQSYVKHAFTDQHNLVLLFGAVCFSVAFASRLPLLAGVAGELLWLGVGPRLPAFRSWVDARLDAQYLARAETAIEGALAELSEREASRFSAVTRNAVELVALAREQKIIPSPELRLAVHVLLELRRTFLDYQFLAQRVTTLTETTTSTELEKEAARLQESYTAERELTTRMTIRQALGAAQKQLEQQRTLQSISRALEQRLEALEKALPVLIGRLAEPGFDQLSRELESVLTEVGSAETLELAVDQTFHSPPANK